MRVAPLVGKAQRSVQLCTAQVNIFEGSVRSGKTIASLLSWLDFIRRGPAGPLLMVGRTERTLIRNLLDPLVDMIGQKRCRVVHGSGMAYILGRKVYLCGANDERSQEKIRGLSLAGAYADELSTLPESFWTMLLTRMSIEHSQIWATSNPDGPFHWLHKDYLQKARLHLTRDGEVLTWPCEQCGQLKHRPDCGGDGRLDLHRFSFKMEDNRTLTPEYIRNTSASLSGLAYRRLVLGEWCLAEGVVYDMFDPARHVLRGPVPPMVRIPGVGVDVGTVNPTAALMLGVQAQDPVAGTPARLVLFREFRHDSKKAMAQKTDAELSRDLRAWIGADRPDWIAVDPSAASFKVQLFRDGHSNVIDARNDVLDGIRLMSSLLATGQLVTHESCAGLIEEMGSYSWDPKAAERGDDKPLKVNDHSNDAARYVLASTRVVWERYVKPALPLATAT